MKYSPSIRIPWANKPPASPVKVICSSTQRISKMDQKPSACSTEAKTNPKLPRPFLRSESPANKSSATSGVKKIWVNSKTNSNPKSPHTELSCSKFILVSRPACGARPRMSHAHVRPLHHHRPQQIHRPLPLDPPTRNPRPAALQRLPLPANPHRRQHTPAAHRLRPLGPNPLLG